MIFVTFLGGARLFILGLNYSSCWSPETDSRDSETETGSLEIELRLHRIHDTSEKRITDDPSPPGEPSQGWASGFPENRNTRSPPLFSIVPCDCSLAWFA